MLEDINNKLPSELLQIICKYHHCNICTIVKNDKVCNECNKNNKICTIRNCNLCKNIVNTHQKNCMSCENNIIEIFGYFYYNYNCFKNEWVKKSILCKHCNCVNKLSRCFECKKCKKSTTIIF